MRTGNIDDSMIQVRLSFVQKIFQRLPATPISSYEMTVAQNMSKLRSIDKDCLDGGLVSLLSRNIRKISVRDALFLLIDSYDLDRIDMAVDLLRSIDMSDRKLDASAIVKIFNDFGTMPFLMIEVLGEDQDEPPEPIRRFSSGLNKDAMKDFLDNI